MVVLITGASSGLGKLTAEEFVNKGHTVYGTSRTPKDFDNGVRMLTLDVCDVQSCKDAVDTIISESGRIDILINNAGIGIAGAVGLTSDEEANLQFETNFFGVHRMCREVLFYMRTQGSGKIINISSAAAAVPIPFQALYSAAKTALEAMSQAMAMEEVPYNIKISSIEFGDMKTGFTENRKITEGAKKDSKGIFRERFERSLRTMEKDERNGPEPVTAARLVYKTAMKRNPRPVIVHGFKYKAVYMLRRLLPLKFSNMLIAGIYAK